MQSHLQSIEDRSRPSDNVPNQTLYIRNINKRVKVPELKCLVLELFSGYGEVLDVVAHRLVHFYGRMEVFVVFRDISCATNALRGLQGFKLMGRELRIVFAKTKSDILALEDGTYKPRIKLKRDEEKKTNQCGPAKDCAKPFHASKFFKHTKVRTPTWLWTFRRVW